MVTTLLTGKNTMMIATTTRLSVRRKSIFEGKNVLVLLTWKSLHAASVDMSVVENVMCISCSSVPRLYLYKYTLANFCLVERPSSSLFGKAVVHSLNFKSSVSDSKPQGRVGYLHFRQFTLTIEACGKSKSMP